MDGKQLDDVARLLASGTNRRRALKGMFVAVAGLAGFRASRVAAGATCFGFEDACDDNGNCCSGSCENGSCTCVGYGSVCYSVDDCCADMLCVSGIRQDGNACISCGDGAACDTNEDCCNGLTCVSGACGTEVTCDETTVCDGECCTGYVCNPETFLCELESTCGPGEPGTCVNYDSECCDGYYCVGQQCLEIPVCAPLYCSSIVPCCDNKVCLDSGGNPNQGEFSGGSCYVRVGQPCDVNGDQGCEVGECVDGYCGGPPECVVEGDPGCTTDSDCCGDLVCAAGTCAPETPGGDDDDDGEAPAPVNTGGETVGGDDSYIPVTLPATGSGILSDQNNHLLKAAGLAAGATALIAGVDARRRALQPANNSPE